MTNTDVLSNEEVDAIMDTVADKPARDSESGPFDGDASIHRAFDFTAREQFALTQMKGLSIANEKFCMEYQRVLTQTFGMPVDVSLSKLDILKIDECMAALQDQAVLNVMKINLASGKGLIVVNNDLISEFINRYFGSQLAQSRGLKADRSLSSTEARINDRVLELFISSLKVGWKDIATLELQKTLTETNPEFVTLGEKEELGVRFTLDITFNDFTGSIEWLLPYRSIEPLSSSADKEASVSDVKAVTAWSDQLYNNMQEVKLNVRVAMVDFDMSLREIDHFQIGTVVPLQTPSDVHLYIEDIPVFSGDYGIHEEKKAMYLKQRIDV